MTTPTGTISLNDVRTELGTSGVITMNDSNVRTLAGVGGSGTIITMDNLRGKSSGPITLTGGNSDPVNASAPANQYAGWVFASDGTVDRIAGTTSSTIAQADAHRWDGAGGVYVRATSITPGGSGLIGGSLAGGAWTLLSGSPSIYAYATDDGGDSSSFTCTIQIATTASDTTIVATGTYSATAAVSV